MATPDQAPRRDLFGDVAVARKLLTWAQMRDALKRQLKYREMGIAIRVGEVCIELGLLNQAQVNEILADQAQRRKPQAPPPAAKPATPEPLAEEFPDDGEAVSLGPYSLEKRLGGVMGIVYRGVDTNTGKTVALKVLPRHLAHELAFVERFKREVRATSLLNHPNIVQVYDAGVLNGVFYLATEFIDGETLNQRQRREKVLSERDVLELTSKLADALSHAHSRNVLHRDIKPENIMVSKTGDVKLADFGLAKLLSDEQRITADGIAVGTPHYIAPEQARALKDTDHRADIYSLGATIFHLVTGRLPYEGDDGAEIMRRHVFDETPDPRTVKPDLSAGVAELILKMMAKNPAQRFQTAAELKAQVDALLAHMQGGVTPPPPPPPAPLGTGVQPAPSLTRKKFAP